MSDHESDARFVNRATQQLISEVDRRSEEKGIPCPRNHKIDGSDLYQVVVFHYGHESMGGYLVEDIAYSVIISPDTDINFMYDYEVSHADQASVLSRMNLNGLGRTNINMNE